MAGSHVPLAVGGFYSDFLHQAWLCAAAEMAPAWLEVDNVERCARAGGQAGGRGGAVLWRAAGRVLRAYVARGQQGGSTVRAVARQRLPLPLACCRRSGLTREQFRQQYEAPNVPVVLTDAMASWPALRKWDRAYLAAALAGRPVRGG